MFCMFVMFCRKLVLDISYIGSFTVYGIRIGAPVLRVSTEPDAMYIVAGPDSNSC
jgi:hypothetical protein